MDRPRGDYWMRRRLILTRRWFAAGMTCYYCSPVCPGTFDGPDSMEVAHVVSWILRPDLADADSNLKPSHGRGKRRCDTCGLNCNWISHNAPDAPMGENGVSLPFTPQFMARQQQERAQFLAKLQRNGREVAIPPETPGKTRPLVVPFRRIDVGREW